MKPLLLKALQDHDFNDDPIITNNGTRHIVGIIKSHYFIGFDYNRELYEVIDGDGDFVLYSKEEFEKV